MIKQKHKRYSDKARSFKINNVEQVFKDKALIDKMSKEQFMSGIMRYAKSYKEIMQVVFIDEKNNIQHIAFLQKDMKNLFDIIKNIRSFRKLKNSKRVEIYKLV